MTFTLQELNEIYYCLGKTLESYVPNMANKDLVNQIADKVRNEIERQAMGNDKGHLSNNEYQQWWEQNKDRILAEDQLNHDMQFKSAYTKQGDY